MKGRYQRQATYQLNPAYELGKNLAIIAVCATVVVAFFVSLVWAIGKEIDEPCYQTAAVEVYRANACEEVTGVVR